MICNTDTFTSESIQLFDRNSHQRNKNVVFAVITGGVVIVVRALQLNKLIGRNRNGKLRFHSFEWYNFENNKDYSHFFTASTNNNSNSLSQ